MTKKYTDAERKERREAVEEQKRQMEQMIQNLTMNWRENPETIAEMLRFGSRIYQYSPRNNMLIYMQNPNATYVQSFKAWKEMGASVKKGEKGYKVYVPVTATLLKIEGQLVPLEHATKEQKLQYKAGEIEGIKKQHFSIGTVFDISQTTYPKENYPKLFQMGYDSVLHGAVLKGLIEYAHTTLQCPVETADMKSIALRGDYSPKEHKIRLNALLEDTEKLSTMSHELGHALLHHAEEAFKKSVEQVELEADALSVMLESHLGIELTEGRKRHLVHHYNKYQEMYTKAPEGEKPDSFGQIISHVFEIYRQEVPVIHEYVEKHLQKEEKTLAHQIQAQKLPGETAKKGEIYERIKREINILDYAQMHGIELQRVGRYYTIKGHDSVRIDAEKNCFWRNSGIGQTTTGSVIDFANAFVHNENLHESLKELSAMVAGGTIPSIRSSARTDAKIQRKEQASLQENLPERSPNMHRVYAYLTQSRFIEPEIVQDFVDRKMLYQDVKGNCVFVSYDETKKPVFANFRGTLTDRKFLGDVEGSDYRRGFYIDNEADKLIVTESVIDAMSIMSILQAQGEDYKQYDYFPLSGTMKQEPLFLHLAEKQMDQVLLALDNDLAGVKAMQHAQNKILDEISGLNMKKEQITFHVPKEPDWNEEVKNAWKRVRPLKEISFLEPTPLPEVHYCAVQSTAQVEEKGFHKRDGKECYRLVELNQKQEIVPAESVKQNVIYYTPQDVKALVRDMYMYELIEYDSLLRMQEERRINPLQQGESAKNPKTEKEQEENIHVQGFQVEDNILMAEVVQDGITSQEAIVKKEDRYYIKTGYVFDHTYQEHDLTEEEKMKLEEYIEEQGLTFVEDTEYPVLMVEQEVNNMKSKQKGTDFLDMLQKQQFQEQDLGLIPEPVMGIGE